jgi:hypothetical protein
MWVIQKLIMYCHESQWLRRRFGLVIGFIGYLQVVTTNNYNTVADLHNLQSLHTNLLSLSALSSRIYNIGTIRVSLNRTLPISLCYSTHKVFKSHVKSSQADFLYSSSTTNFPWLSPTENWLDLNWTNYVTYIAKEQTCITGNTCRVTISHRCMTSPRTWKTQPPLLLSVGLCLQSCCLATRWSKRYNIVTFTNKWCLKNEFCWRNVT